jgi:hypothetical protein
MIKMALFADWKRVVYFSERSRSDSSVLSFFFDSCVFLVFAVLELVSYGFAAFILYSISVKIAAIFKGRCEEKIVRSLLARSSETKKIESRKKEVHPIHDDANRTKP